MMAENQDVFGEAPNTAPEAGALPKSERKRTAGRFGPV